MRKDEMGQECPETLGEYRDLVRAIAGSDTNKAVMYLDEKIAKAEKGREAKVLAPDSQMRQILFPMIVAGIKASGFN